MPKTKVSLTGCPLAQYEALRYKPDQVILGGLQKECRRIITRYSLYGVVEFILLIFPVWGRGVYTPDFPCTGLWSLYSRYSLYGVVGFILPILPARGRGVYTPDTLCMGSWSLLPG